MSSINNVLDIAKNALLSTQKAVSVTSHNIANANTPGYSRQRANLAATNPVSYGGLFFGTGVKVENIQRVYDDFQAIQLRDANSAFSMYDSKNSALSALEGILNDLEGSGLSSQLDKFFNGLQDVSNDPASYADRSTLLSTASMLADKFNTIDSSIKQNIANMNQQISAQVGTLNSLAEQVAQLNNQISTVEVASGVTANDLRDKRDQILGDISNIVDIKVIENNVGEADVYLAGGVFLVTGVNSATISVATNDDNPDIYNIVGNGIVLNDRIAGGTLKGTLEGAAAYQENQDKFDLLAAALMKEINVQHQAGYGLDGSTNQDFFTTNSLYTKADATNTGGAAISLGTVSDLSLVTLDDYEVRFSSPTAYNVVNTASGSTVTSGAYTSGAAITFDGLSVTITDNTSAPGAGDSFAVSFTTGAAGNFGVSLTDPNKVAASGTAAGAPGDNTNALAMVALKDADTVAGSTFREYYSGTITDLGISARESSSQLKAQKNVVEQLEVARESLSGVSIEEEAINLMMLQKAYEASAKVLTTADKMLDTIIHMV